MNLNFHPDEQGPLTCVWCGEDIDREALDRCIVMPDDNYHGYCYEIRRKKRREKREALEEDS